MTGMEPLIFSPSEFVAVLNQTLEYAYPNVTIEGELSNFRVVKNRWVYFDLKDDAASLRFFGTVYLLPGPLQDGLMLRAIGAPRLHPKFGFTINLMSLMPVGEGSIKKAADLLRVKLQAEGLFDEDRKRALPAIPKTIGLVTAGESAAYADFIKILNSRWGGVEVLLADCLVQGDQAPGQLIEAIEHFNQLPDLPDVIVVTRGGGSAEDLAAFNDERVVRAVAASRVLTLVGVGHEVDESLAELAADKRASTPSNAAQMAVPDRREVLQRLEIAKKSLTRDLGTMFENNKRYLKDTKTNVRTLMESALKTESEKLAAASRLVALFDPLAALKRGYSLVIKSGKYITSATQIGMGDDLSLQFHDGQVAARAGRRIK